MRIDRLVLENFKKYAKQDFDFHPKFTLLVGDNSAGKTTVLDALAVAAGVWLVEPPDMMLCNSGRIILPTEIRLDPEERGDRTLFNPQRPAIVSATGRIGDHEAVVWTRQIRKGGRRTSNGGAKEAIRYVADIYDRDRAGERLLCPVLAYYGAGRTWLPSNKKSKDKAKPNSSAHRWAAFYDCFNERIRTADLQDWFLGEAIASVNRAGRFRPGFEVVKRAILRCMPGASRVWYETDLKQIVLTIDGNSQPFDNLSAGQRMMLALVADLAIKAVTQNAHLLPPDELGPDDESLPRVLRETPGVVLIDELDVHLHPKWQRRVATDLKTTFPSIQFVCTSHSPQVIGQVMPDEVRLLRVKPDSQDTLQREGEGAIQANEFEKPSQSFGMDSNWILKVLMGGNEMDPEIKNDIRAVQELAVKREFRQARELLKSLRERVGNSENIQFAASTIDRVELLGK
jgi:predicted ATP-binding protein involved in virulence